MSNITYVRKIEQIRARKQFLEKKITQCDQQIKHYNSELQYATKSLAILQAAAKQTQNNLKTQLSDLVTLAFENIFEDPYAFLVDFVERRNQTECDLWFVKNDVKLRPKFASGYGVLDVCSFALRLAYWQLEKTAPVIIVDEPFKHLSRSYIPAAIALLQSLTEILGVQIIIITHIEEITKNADKVFEVKKGTINQVRG